MFNQNDTSYHAIVQTIVSSTKFQNFALNEFQHTRKLVTLEIGDQEGKSLAMKLASQLNRKSKNLTTGMIIKLINLQALKHSDERNQPVHSIMLCTNMQVIGFETKLIELCNHALKEAQNSLKSQ